jgi:hypothetical protein
MADCNFVDHVIKLRLFAAAGNPTGLSHTDAPPTDCDSDIVGLTSGFPPDLFHDIASNAPAALAEKRLQAGPLAAHGISPSI